MTTFSFLDYLNNPSFDNIKLVHKASGLTQAQVTQILGIGLQTYKGWQSKPSTANYRQPHTVMWNMLLYELEARRLGYENLSDFFSKNS
ncbi:MAG: hypothetical protein Q4A69_08415 [Moraxella sp.]|nr:hypothetical protein [Moraxella sp.]